MDIINSHWSPQVTAVFEGLMGKMTDRQTIGQDHLRPDKGLVLK